MKNLNFGCSIFVVLIAFLALFGEVRCIYKFFTSDFEPSYKREIVYAAGALTGLGSIVGWMNIEDTPQVKPVPANAGTN